MSIKLRKFSMNTTYSAKPVYRRFSKPQEPNYAFLMLGLSDSHDTIEQIHKQITINDIYEKGNPEYGLENETHVTIIPCMDNNVNHDLIHQLADEDFNYDISFDKVDIFNNDDYDVLVIKLKSDKLHEANKKICEVIPTHSEYEYNPHATIAYLKKGTGDKYKKIAEDIILGKVIPDAKLKLDPVEYILSWHEDHDGKDTMMQEFWVPGGEVKIEERY